MPRYLHPILPDDCITLTSCDPIYKIYDNATTTLALADAANIVSVTARISAYSGAAGGGMISRYDSYHRVFLPHASSRPRHSLRHASNATSTKMAKCIEGRLFARRVAHRKASSCMY